MSEAWPSAQLAASLRQLGYDLEATAAADDGSLIARRDLGDRVIVLALDRSGRFRIEITRTVEEQSAPGEIAGVPVRVVGTITRTVTITGQVADPSHIIAVVSAVEAILGWGGAAGTPPPGDSC
jgi:hypothetical protein